ncbi:hypothetical protein RHS02_02804, partial [Rhizoctonia solani]
MFAFCHAKRLPPAPAQLQPSSSASQRNIQPSWSRSPAYYDDLLHMKFRSLTYNSVDKLRKLKVEDDLVDSHPEFRITHEQFIQALDVTDPFTQQIIEILVKEIATRRHTRTNRANTRSTATCSARTANALFNLWESCRGAPPSHLPRRSEFVFGSHVWDGDSETEDVGMDELTPEPEPLIVGGQAPVTLGSRIGSSLRDAGSSSSSTWSSWRPLDVVFSPPNRPLEIPSPPPPPAPSTRPHSSLLSLVSARNPVTRPSSIRRPASANSVTYFRPRHRTADFEAQTQRLRDRARTRDLLGYASGSNTTNGNNSSMTNQVPPESFARREGGPRSDGGPLETQSSPLSPELPPAPMPAHAHPHSSGPSHNTLRRVTSELSSLDRSMEAHRRELTAAREDFAARFRRGVSTFTPIYRRSESPISMTGPSSSSAGASVIHPQPRESLRAALWGTGPGDEEGLPTPRSLTPESGERGPTA